MENSIFPVSNDSSMGIEPLDWLAASAMQGLLASYHDTRLVNDADKADALATQAYIIADAMIKESRRRKP